MPVWRLACYLVALLTLGAGGCAHCRPGGCAGCGSAAPTAVEEALPAIAPQGFEFDISDVGAPHDVDQALGRPFPRNVRYRGLSAETCQCMAVENSSQGNSLAAERRSVLARASKHHGLSEEDRVRVRALRASELEARNKSASAALETYYSLAEVEANMSIVEASLAEIDGTLADVKRLRNQGVKLPFDESELTRKRIDLVDKRTDLDLKAGQLNAQLTRLLGLQTTDPNVRIWPTTDWKVVVEPIDLDAAVQEGLSLRPELQFLNSLPNSLNTETIGVVSEIVAGAGGLIGAQSKVAGLVERLGLRDLFGGRQAKERELPVRRRQLAEFTQQRRLDITTEIQQGVHAVENSLRQIAVAKQRMQSWDRRLAELRSKQRIEEASFVDQSVAQLSAFQAQSDQTHQIIGWKIAQAKLKEAQGKLVLECQSGEFHNAAMTQCVAREQERHAAPGQEQRLALVPPQPPPETAPERPAPLAPEPPASQSPLQAFPTFSDGQSDWMPGVDYVR
ncbi:MAG TPA: hypothetical protein VHC19_18560 [Pirellulales bacterium]|jgi:hypothetical protein|nr:hypothetical protein [Pirellulales bacterium]